jgi:hypothetical protein
MEFGQVDRALTDPVFFVNNSRPLIASVRPEDPIHWTQGRVRPFWSITRHDEIVAVFGQPNLSLPLKRLIVPSRPEIEQLTPRNSIKFACWTITALNRDGRL